MVRLRLSEGQFALDRDKNPFLAVKYEFIDVRTSGTPMPNTVCDQVYQASSGLRLGAHMPNAVCDQAYQALSGLR